MGTRIKLEALGYPDVGGFDIEDVESVRQAVVWVESTKIRRYGEAERGAMVGGEWEEEWGKYLSALGAPFGAGAEDEGWARAVDWVVGRAVAHEYADVVAAGRGAGDDGVEAEASGGAAGSSSVGGGGDAVLADGAVEAAVMGLARALGVPDDGDPLETLRAVAHVVHTRCAGGEGAGLAVSDADALALCQNLEKKFPVGFDTGDPIVNRAVTILKLLYVRDLRELQTQINELIVAVQSVTADPRANHKLGKVGR